MISENWREYLINERKKYKKLTHIKCPAFNDEEVHFNRYGFDHIVFKEGIPRPQVEVRERFGLLLFLPNILKDLKHVDGEEKRIKNQSIAYFWTIKYRLNNRLNIRIILRRLNNGTIHFFSIMKE